MGNLSNIIKDIISLDNDLKKGISVKTKKLQEIKNEIEENKSNLYNLLDRLPSRGFFKTSNKKLFDQFIRELDLALKEERPKNYLTLLKKNLSLLIAPLLFVNFAYAECDVKMIKNSSVEDMKEFREYVLNKDSSHPLIQKIENCISEKDGSSFSNSSLSNNSEIKYNLDDPFAELDLRTDLNNSKAETLVMAYFALKNYKFKDGEFRIISGNIPIKIKKVGNLISVTDGSDHVANFSLSQFEIFNSGKVTINQILNVI